MAKNYFTIVMLITAMISSFFYPVKADSVNAASVKEEIEPRLIFLGDSLTAGFGLDQKYSYPSLISKRIKEERGSSKILPFKVVNAGISGDTTAGGLRRLSWLLNGESVSNKDVLVLALGANDGLRGIDPNISKENLRKIITSAKEINPEITILLVGMRAPPNMGENYTNRFDSIFPELAKEFNLPFVPFLLEGVAANSELNLLDGIHPNEKGYQLIADMIWTVLQPYLLE